MNEKDHDLIEKAIEKSLDELTKLEAKKDDEISFILSKNVMSKRAVKQSIVFIAIVVVLLITIRFLQETGSQSVWLEISALVLNGVISLGFSLAIYNILLFPSMINEKEVKKFQVIAVGVIGISLTVGFSQLLYQLWYRADMISPYLDMVMLIVIFAHMLFGFNKRDKIRNYFDINKIYHRKMIELIDKELEYLKSVVDKNSHS